MPNQTIISGVENQKLGSMLNSIHALRVYHLIKEDLPTRTIFHEEEAIHHHRKLARQTTTKVSNKNFIGNGLMLKMKIVIYLSSGAKTSLKALWYTQTSL